MLTWWVLVSVIEPSNKIGAWLILGILVANLMSDFSNALACRLIRTGLVHRDKNQTHSIFNHSW